MSSHGEGYLTPAGYGDAELSEKRSRFIGYITPAQSQEEARAFIARIKAKHYDARHNAWCYALRDGAERYSDDGEPQGTAGLPMLEMFRREEITDFCCVVTRYFGGILLGPGGLARAYTEAASLALGAAGVSEYGLYRQLEVVCPYALFERVRLEIKARGGILGGADYGAQITLRALFRAGEERAFAERLTQLSAGAVTPRELGAAFMPVSKE